MSIRSEKDLTILEDELRCAHAEFSAAACCETLGQISDGQLFRFYSNTLELLRPTRDERAVMRQSVRTRTEYGIVIVNGVKEVIKGGSYVIMRKSFEEALSRVESTPDKPLFFSHTHWDPKGDPLPSNTDLVTWWELKEHYRDCDVRLIFNQGRRYRVLRWHGQDKLHC